MPIPRFNRASPGTLIDVTAEAWNALVDAVEQLANPSVIGASAFVMNGAQWAMAIDPSGQPGVLVYTTGIYEPPASGSSAASGSGVALGPGVYEGLLVGPPASAIDPTAQLTPAALGTTANRPSVHILNVAEVYGAGHSLLINAYYSAVPAGTASDGQQVYVVQPYIPAPTAKYQLLTATDDTLQLRFTVGRFIDAADGDLGYSSTSGSNGSSGSGT